MNDTRSNIAANLRHLRKANRMSQEEVAEKIGVSRQAAAKWENGDSLPDLVNCEALADLYDVSLDDLVRYDAEAEGMPIPPRNKHLFGVVTLGERGADCASQEGPGHLQPKTGRYPCGAGRY